MGDVGAVSGLATPLPLSPVIYWLEVVDKDRGTKDERKE